MAGLFAFLIMSLGAETFSVLTKSDVSRSFSCHSCLRRQSEEPIAKSKFAETFPTASFSALYSLGSAVRVRGPLRADGWRAAGPDSAAPAPPAEGAVPSATVEILLLFVKIVLSSSLSKAKWPKGTQARYCSSPPIYMPVSHHYHTVSIPVALQ